MQMSRIRGMIPAAIALCLLPLSAVHAGPPVEPLEMTTIMAEPDWIGPPVEAAWWAMDGEAVYYRVKRDGSPVRDIHRIGIDGQGDTVLSPAAQAGIPGEDPVYNHARTRAVYLRHGDVFLHDLETGGRRQLTRTEAGEAAPVFGANGETVYYRRGFDWFRATGAAPAGPVALLRAEDDPGEEPEPDTLRDMQMRLFETLREAEDDEQARREHERALRAADPERVPEPVYLGADREIVGSSLSPNGRWLVVATRKAGNDDGQSGQMPRYVTESGYVAVEDVRTRVGRKPPDGHNLHLVDLDTGALHELDDAALSGLTDDPLAELKHEQDIEVDPDAERPWTVAGIEWTADGERVAVQLRAVDNKDRWIATVDFEERALVSRHRLTDPAWINWNFNQFGWMPDSDTLWYLSEESGYSHFYTRDISGDRARQRTEGEWEIHDLVIAPDGEQIYFLANRERPIEYELYRMDMASGRIDALTDLDGVETFTLGPRGERILLRWSGSYTPPQAAVLDIAGKTTQKLTDTRTAEYREYDWLQPEFVQVPSTRVERPIWSKLYKPAEFEEGRSYPVVMFVHGAGYTQNTHQRFPYYFREQMFHNLLVQRGYIVLDMDYRASEGYGRDWRTAIYRRMGHPELEDLIDGVDWLAGEYPVDRERIGVYGGSYGGFMSLMALFRAPDVFEAGAALRPVTDWAHYNHGYTSNILNTPEVDPEAYRRSSPIEYAEGLAGHLLIAHGMLDGNVFYQDSVRLAQRLIELEKEDWELASYPQEPHSFEDAEAWLDEYRRILKLFEGALRGDVE